jgi:PhzF family phenazine biosynthesis protein
MQLDVYQIDAFSDRPFAGNPAGVVPLKAWLPDATLQSIAAEINQAETAFFAPEGDHYRIRWFTPTTEVKLCGHATLASAHVLHTLGQAPNGKNGGKIVFDSLSGPLSVSQSGDKLELDFPRHDAHPEPQSLAKVAACFDVKPVEMHVSESYDAYLALYEKAADIERLTPDFAGLNALDRTVIVTARGTDGIDFVSRYFAPTSGIPEDPVTGSTHCVLATFWSRVLGKNDFHARQVSKRGGDLWLKLEGDRVKIAGFATAVIKGTISV